MDNRNIIKNYNDTVKTCKKDKSEEKKQQFIIIFNELDLQLNKELSRIVKSKDNKSTSLEEEIDKLETIIRAIEYRENFRENMVNDYKKIIGYKPKKLNVIPYTKDEYEKELEKYRFGYEIIEDVMKKGLSVTNLKETLSKKKRGKKKIEDNIKKLQKERAISLDKLKNNQEVLDALYNFTISAPFSEENSYIEYLLIKINEPTNEEEEKKEEKPKLKLSSVIEGLEDPPEIEYLRPTNILDEMKKAVEKYGDINIPNYNLVSSEPKIKITFKK